MRFGLVGQPIEALPKPLAETDTGTADQSSPWIAADERT